MLYLPKNYSATIGATLNNHYPHPIIAREGWPFLGIAVALAIVVTLIGGAWSIPFWIIALFVLSVLPRVLRAPSRKSECRVSPADGRIVVVPRRMIPTPIAKRSRSASS